ncbi:transferrin-like [Aricia agestis]|uniref:transferrin-like n=1 Tax=Aricia agestis TaxID=91739 RepID=UPI001C20B234|nr:transferrin-like [Aricia agestis]
MKRLCVILLCSWSFVETQDAGTGSGTNGNLRLCIVEGKGAYKRGAKYCPVLDDEKSGIECVLGIDRLDCLRRISKGTVDFGVFSPEDLIAAKWANIDVLVTNELRLRPRPFERSVVAVVNRRILPATPWSLEAVLRNTTLCHPGNGVTDLRPLSDTLAGYLESLIVTRSCDPQLSLTENRLKAMASFFFKACKAGPWVPNVVRDADLKKRYPSLCEACNTATCSPNDRYWGTAGATACLVEEAGDVMWAELDDVTSYFGLNTKSTPQYGSPDNFAFLCRDGTWQPLRDNAQPCVWLNRPWSVVVAKRKAAESVGTLLSTLKDGLLLDGHWHGALAALLEAREPPTVLLPPRAPLDHLASARGFQEAYSQTGCNPSRHITICTTSLLEKNKCEWMSEAAAVYGVAPPLQCRVAGDARACLASVQAGDSDVTVLGSDWLVPATRDYKLESLLYETTPIVEKMDTVMAYVKKDSNIESINDLRGKRAAFPVVDGLAWHAALQYLKKMDVSSCSQVLHGFFGEVCAPGVELRNVSADVVDKYTKSCYKDGELTVTGEMAALRSLLEGKSDVAFISMKTIAMYQNKQIVDPWANVDVEIVPVCPEENKKFCYLSWAHIGHVYAANNLTDVRRNEIVTVFTKLDQLFGKHQPFHSPMFTMFGPYNFQLDVLFHNNTKSLATEHVFDTHPYDTMPFNFERSLANGTRCTVEDISASSAFVFSPSLVILLSSLVFLYL